MPWEREEDHATTADNKAAWPGIAQSQGKEEAKEMEKGVGRHHFMEKQPKETSKGAKEEEKEMERKEEAKVQQKDAGVAEDRTSNHNAQKEEVLGV